MNVSLNFLASHQEGEAKGEAAEAERESEWKPDCQVHRSSSRLVSPSGPVTNRCRGLARCMRLQQGRRAFPIASCRGLSAIVRPATKSRAGIGKAGSE